MSIIRPMRVFALSIMILVLGTVALRSFTHATQTNRFEIGEELSSVQTDLARLIEELSRKEQSLADNHFKTMQIIDEMQATQNKTNSVLDQVVQQLRKSAAVKYVTKSDLDSVIDVAKQSVEQVKAATPDGCDCDCRERIAQLEDRIAKLEALCATKANAYSTKSGGSTGSVGATQYYSVTSAPVVYTQSVGGGSNGSVSSSVYQTTSTPVYQTTSAPVRSPAVISRTVTSSSNAVASPQCYIDENGNSVCPSQASAVQTSKTTTLSRPRLFRR